MSDPVVYRVFKIPEPTVTAMRTERNKRKETNAVFVAAAVDSSLPNLVQELTRLGFVANEGEAVTTRLPFSDEAATLGLLREASEATGLPVSKLLNLCLAASVGTTGTKKRRRRRRQQAQ